MYGGKNKLCSNRCDVGVVQVDQKEYNYRVLTYSLGAAPSVYLVRLI